MKGILKGLFSLCISIVGIVSFCNAEKVESLVNYSYLNLGLTGLENLNSFQYSHVLLDIGTDYGTYCFTLTGISLGNPDVNPGKIVAWLSQSTSTDSINTNNFQNQGTRVSLRGNQIGATTCFAVNKRYIIGILKNNASSTSNATSVFYFNVYKLNDLLDTDIPQYTSSECQQEYNLIPIESVNQNYCESNNLCPTCNYSGYENSLNVCTNNLNTCQSNLSSCLAGNYTGLSWSSLYINNIQHLGGPSIYLDIPEEINRDYQYSSNEDMYIDIDGYNVNYDSISGAIAIQNYKPDSSDLNKIITELIPLFVPGLVIVLFLYFVFRFIKKLF